MYEIKSNYLFIFIFLFIFIIDCVKKSMLILISIYHRMGWHWHPQNTQELFQNCNSFGSRL